jgi:hypothetical protein
MRHIYKGASCVLTLDRWIQEIPKTTSVVEKSSRLYLSNWQHRLWTCQEGVFAETLYFQFSDGPQRMKELEEEAELGKDQPCKSTIPSFCLGSVPAFNEGKLEGFPLELKFQPIIMAIRARTTTKKKDETVCIATLLDLDPDCLLHVNDGSEEDICEKRMQRLYELITTIPQGLIFSKLNRLRTAGYRWSPRTFLGQKLSEPLWGDSPNLENGEGGCLVPDHGLMVHYPAYLIETVGELPATPLHITNGVKHYIVEPDLDDGGVGVHLERSERYAIVTSSAKSSEAILCAFDGIVGDDILPWPVQKLLYLFRVAIRPSNSKGRKKEIISFQFKRKGEWIIG